MWFWCRRGCAAWLVALAVVVGLGSSPNGRLEAQTAWNKIPLTLSARLAGPVKAGESFTVAVDLSEIVEARSFAFDLTFDPTVVEARPDPAGHAAG